jgi:hypothetical protein
VRTVSFAINSKQPTCTPASIVIGAPPSIAETNCDAKCRLKSILSRAIASLTSTVDGASTKWTSLKPSACSSCSATNWGAWQIAGVRIRRTVVVSSAPSAASPRGARIRLAPPASDRVVRKLRRVCLIGI